jgi:hypothetical protein
MGKDNCVTAAYYDSEEFKAIKTTYLAGKAFRIKLEDLPFETRLRNSLRQGGMSNLQEILNYNLGLFIKIRNLGYDSNRTLVEFINKLREGIVPAINEDDAEQVDPLVMRPKLKRLFLVIQTFSDKELDKLEKAVVSIVGHRGIRSDKKEDLDVS